MSSLSQLQADLDTPLIAWGTGAAGCQVGEQISNIVPRMPIQTGPQSLLIQVMRNQTNTSSENEKAIENSHVEIILGFLRGESAAIAQ